MTNSGESTMQKVKDVLHVGNKNNTTTTGTHAGTTHTGHTSTTGTHAGTTHTGTTGTHAGTTHTGTTGSHIPGTTNHTTTRHAEGAHGPHSSSAANAADPRVDSDMDGNRLPNQMSSGYGTADQSAFGTTGTTGTTGTHRQHQGTTAGNHVGGTGFNGGISHSTNAGPHNSNTANAVDPRVDSDLSSTGNRHGAQHGGILGASGSHATPGSGTAQNTAGPHNSDMLNKADPRVDADLDGSKTLGGNKTYK